MSTFGRNQTAVPKIFLRIPPPSSSRRTRVTAHKPAANTIEDSATQSSMVLSQDTTGSSNANQPASGSSNASQPAAGPSNPPNETSTAGPTGIASSDSGGAPDAGTTALLNLSSMIAQLVQGQNAQQATLQESLRMQREDSRHVLTQLTSLAEGRTTRSAPQNASVNQAQPSNGDIHSLDHDANRLGQQTFVPPPTNNTGAGTSLQSLFPEIEEGTLLAIGRHTIKPGLIYKLDTRLKDKPTATFLDFENGAIVHREREPSVKEYPSFLSLYNPLVLYFSVLQIAVSSSGNLPAIRQVIFSCNEYLRTLYDLYIEYEWTSVLNYHFTFHAKRLTEMARGDYSHWGEIDGALQTKFLIGHPRARLSKERPSSSTSNGADVSKQICNMFNYGKCTRAGCKRIHKCKGCQSADHGQSTCSSKPS
jgi:hypothetical protein